MKNIHLLPTDKPSRLHLAYDKYYYLSVEPFIQLDTKNYKSFNIYITSDEEIKEDYVIAYGVVIKVMMFDKETLYFVNGTKAKREDCKKIILTTDQDLIKDGVQAIDDEFLEWFVKNPSCEKVEVVDNLKYFNVDELRERHLKGLPHLYSEKIGYKIIIPKEEPKKVGEYQQELFSYLHDLGITALQSEMQEIERIVLNMQQEQIYDEESECVNMYLDDLNIPRKSEDGKGYSIVGRIKQLEKRYLKELSEVENHYLQQLNKQDMKIETQGYICPHTKLHCDDECCVSAEDCHIEAGFGIVYDCEPPKQETLEEVAERLYPYEVGYGVFDRNCEIDIERERFVEGVKYQQEQDKKLYSEEEVLEHLNYLNTMPSSKLDLYIDEDEMITSKWFEQFKKK